MIPENLHWRRVSEIFDLVVDIAPDHRDERLNELCAEDMVLRRKVEALLRADAAAVSFDARVKSAHASAVQDWNDDVEAERSGRRIGSWRILRELGRGGMGVVLLAERADGQYEQHAALKLIKRGMDSDAILTRFLRERQILARLEHPHIARLLDGGVADDDRPYFAMEYIVGEPLLDYCRARKTSLDARLELFLQVCSAVQFAHGQLVVHRDIKPSNLLVTEQGQAKLLDFGIAKLIDAGSSDTGTLLWHDRPLTLAYAGPEQLRGEAATVATDIYGLGCVLYELLTDQRPYNIGDAPALDEVRSLLEAGAPRAPSQRTDAEAPVPPRQLRGDLDTIVLQALRHEPERRYATVDAFAGDIRRYLGGLPISARREQRGYRLRKFVKRHYLGVAASALAILLLFAITGYAVWQARAKAREALASEQVSTFLVGLFAAADPTHSRGVKVSAEDLLNQGAQRLHQELDGEPVLRARLAHTMAVTYTALGLYGRALPLAEYALALRRENLVAGDPDIADSLNLIGMINTNQADYAKAEPVLREALALRLQRLPKDDPAIIDSYSNIGTLLQKRGDFADADAYFRDALAASERRFGNEAAETARRLDDQAVNLDQLGKREEALTAFRRALAIRERQLQPNDPEIATSLDNLGNHLSEDSHLAEGAQMLERAVAIRKQVFGVAHPLVAFAEIDLAGVYLDTGGKAEQARKLIEDALSIQRASLPDEHPKIAETLNMLAISDTAQDRYEEAAPVMREVVARFEKISGPDHPDTLVAKNNLAAILLHLDNYEEAERLQRAVIEHMRADDGQGTIVKNYENFSDTLAHEGKVDEAVEYARKAVAAQKRLDGESSLNVAVAIRHLAYMEEFSGDAEAAEAHLREAQQMGKAADSGHDYGIYPWTLPLADFLIGAGRCSEALPLLDAARVEFAKQQSLNVEYSLQEKILRGHCAKPTDAVARQAGSAALQELRRKQGILVDAFPNVGRWAAASHL